MDMLSWTEERPNDLLPIQRTTGNEGMLRAGEIVFPRREHSNWSSKWSDLKTCTQVTLYRLRGLLSIYFSITIYLINLLIYHTHMYMYIHLTYFISFKINEKVGHTFEKDQGVVCG